MLDEDIRTLNSLVDRTPGRASAQALKQLSDALARRHIPAADLTIQAGQAESPLDGHVLLASSSVVYTHLDKLWPAIHGSGQHANRTFGDLTQEESFQRAVAAFRDPKVVGDMRVRDFQPDCIGVRVALCIRVLGANSSAASTMPQVFRSVQRHLSELLLTYPVLLHPKVMVPVERDGNTEYMSVLHALSYGSGGLPRRSHFVGRSCGLQDPLRQEDADARLRTFANHPCVRHALRTQASVHVTIGSGNPGHQRSIIKRSLRLVKTAFATASPRVQFLASLMEMQAHTGEVSQLPLARASRGANDSGDEERRNVLEALALSVFPASGLIHASGRGSVPNVADDTGESATEPPAPWRHHPADCGFLECLKARATALIQEPAYADKVRNSITRGIFLGRFDELSGDDVRLNTQALIAGLVRSGFAASVYDAGVLTLQSVLGRDRPNERLPRAEVVQACEFLSAIAETGAFDTPHSPLFETIEIAVAQVPDHAAVPYRDTWLRALAVFENTRIMKSVMDRNRTKLQDGASKAGRGEPMTGDTRRRRAPV